MIFIKSHIWKIVLSPDNILQSLILWGGMQVGSVERAGQGCSPK